MTGESEPEAVRINVIGVVEVDAERLTPEMTDEQIRSTILQNPQFDSAEELAETIPGIRERLPESDQ